MARATGAKSPNALTHMHTPEIFSSFWVNSRRTLEHSGPIVDKDSCRHFVVARLETSSKVDNARCGERGEFLLNHTPQGLLYDLSFPISKGWVSKIKLRKLAN